MNKKCRKCLTEIDEKYFVHYAVPSFGEMENISLCHQCNCIYDNRSFMLIEFIKEDYGLFPIDKIDQRMIEARKYRSSNKGPWQSNEDLLQKIP